MFENSKNKEFFKLFKNHSIIELDLILFSIQLEMDEAQMKYLAGLIHLGYSNTEAMEAWYKRDKCDNREKDKTSATREVILSGRVLLDDFIIYQKTKLSQQYWDDLIKSLHLESLFDHFNKETSTPATATNALQNIIEGKKIRNSKGETNSNRKLRDQWKAFTDAGWDFLNFNPLAISNHSDGISGKSGVHIVSLYLEFVIYEVLLQRFDQEFKSSESVKEFFKGIYFSHLITYFSNLIYYLFILDTYDTFIRMLKSRRYNASQTLKSTNSVYRWVKNLNDPVTKILPNGNEIEIKGSLQKNTRTRQQKRTRGQMANNREFRLNKAVDYGDASEKYNYSKKQQSSSYENFDSEESDEVDEESDEVDDQEDDQEDDQDEDEEDGKFD
jgi:hypothetical protein